MICRGHSLNLWANSKSWAHLCWHQRQKASPQSRWAQMIKTPQSRRSIACGIGAKSHKYSHRAGNYWLQSKPLNTEWTPTAQGVWTVGELWSKATTKPWSRTCRHGFFDDLHLWCLYRRKSHKRRTHKRRCQALLNMKQSVFRCEAERNT